MRIAARLPLTASAQRQPTSAPSNVLQLIADAEQLSSQGESEDAAQLLRFRKLTVEKPCARGVSRAFS